MGWRPESELLRLTLRVDNVFDTAYADRADFAFGNYRWLDAAVPRFSPSTTLRTETTPIRMFPYTSSPA